MIKKYFNLLLLLLPLAAGAQTVTNVIDRFDPAGIGADIYSAGKITNVWANWFGSAFQSLSWDAVSDANTNAGSGSLKITANFPVVTDQFEVWDGIDGISPTVNGVQFTNFQCDVRFAAGSATNSSGKFGTLEFGVPTPGYGQNYFGSVAVSASNTNWVHVSIALNAASNTNLLNITGLLIHIWGAGLSGPSTLWVDNLQFTGMATNTGMARIDYNDTHQRIDGFGASSAWDGTWNTQQAEIFFSTNTGAGLSLLRTRIAPDGSTVEGGIAQMAQARGARVWSTPWSPTSNFKITNSWIPTNNPNGYNGGWISNSVATFQGYASQLAKNVALMKNTYGVNLYGLSIQNEPDANVNYESCQWTAKDFHDFLPYLDAAMTASNVSATKIMLPESMHWQFSHATNTMSDVTTSNLLDILAGHNYGSSAAPVTQFGTPCPKTLWETEHYFGSGSDITNGLALAQQIHSFLTVAEASAYHYWWLKTYGGNGCLAGDSTITPAKRLFAMGNYSKFVRPGFYRVGLANSSTALITAFKDSIASNIVIVAANPSPYPVNQTVVLTNFPVVTNLTPWFTSATQSLGSGANFKVTNNIFSFTLPAWTVVSFASLTGTALTLTNTDQIGKSSFNQTNDSGSLASANWSNGQWPTYINDYFTGTNTLRTPSGVGDVIFPGGSLTLQNPFGLYFKGNSGSKVTISNLILTNGGGVCQALNSSTAFTLEGNLTVAGGQFYNSGDATRSITNATTMSGSGPLTNTGAGLVVYTDNNSAFTGPLIVNSNTTLQASSQNNLGGDPAVFNDDQLLLDNGAFQPTASFALNNPHSGVTIGVNGGTFNIAAGLTLTISNPISGAGNLFSLGGGTLFLATSNNATGNLIVSNSTLKLIGNASLKNFLLGVSNNATLDVTALSIPLAVSNRIALAGNLIVNCNSTNTSSRLSASNVVYGGTLTLSNSGPAFAAGNSFTLFAASNYSGAFTGINPATPGSGFVWDASKLAVSGMIQVSQPPTVNVTPVSTNVIYGNIVVLAANVTGTGPLSYQWYDNHTNTIAGAVYSSFTNTPAVAGNGNYSVVVTNSVGRATNFASLNISKALLTVTADITNRPYGTPNPVLTGSLMGIQNGDIITATYVSPAAASSPAGNYVIAPVLNDPSSRLPNYVVTTNLGTLTVTLASNPTNLTSSVNGMNLTLTWPMTYLGWTLQSQTNTLTNGLGTNWADVPNSSTTNQVILQMNPANDSVFYRLRR